MIPFEFVYLRPDTLAEAVQAHRAFSLAGRQALYYAGGSEIISMSRVGAIRPDAVIDIKRIPECNALSADRDGLTVGAALSLNRIKESRSFALLTLSCGRIADHTNQCRITLGGNLCGTIIYREASLALLLSDATVALCGPDGLRTVAFTDVFWGRMRLGPGEMVVSVCVPAWALAARHAHIKRTAHEKIDYPLVSLGALWKDGAIRVAFSGLAAHPLRSLAVEQVLNDRGAPAQSRAERAAALLAGEAHTDVEGSKDYRLFVVRNTLKKVLEDWDNDAL